MSDDRLRIGGRELSIRRPHGGSRGLRGWDAADELLIEQALAHLSGKAPQKLLILDDQFGAISLALKNYASVCVADSATLSSAMQLNAEGPPSPVDSWLTPPDGKFDLVVMRIPRQADYLAWLLRWVNQRLTSQGVIIAGGMIKHLPDRSADVFRELVYTRTVCPARKKARVILAEPGTATLDDWSDLWRGYPLSDTGPEIEALPAVFSRRKLDIGTRELLPLVQQASRTLEPGGRVLDLACGNGVLGLSALIQRPDLHVTFSDVSSQALLSARHNLERALPESEAEFIHCDGAPESLGEFDLILLNPPFHEGGVVGDHIALRLFEMSARRLAPGGRLLMVGNRHLGYHQSLKRSFKRVRQLAASPKFVVFEASRQEAGRS
ncbi:class I SAM-dependent methyltransferase [Marinobacter sp. CHS3-4]|uniref:class I SAM-dependent methyltransferase n=1 Tax=Marinobacter sp. CHS3-4 TaxID=3045174 RepID=UPI0024B57DE5|nr:class I SAM-dependent methyltransferase [Marinobacter sp. CHS3-4]MDI9245858.1 class I SAM-dependent methyltransferase [Marinobacter sp. CHS3-4]